MEERGHEDLRDGEGHQLDRPQRRMRREHARRQPGRLARRQNKSECCSSTCISTPTIWRRCST